MCCHPLLPSCISLAQLTHVDGVARLLALGARQLTLLLPLLPISAVVLTSAASSTELLLSPMLASLPSIQLLILLLWSSAVSQQMSGVAAVVASLLRLAALLLASASSIRAIRPVMSEFLTSVASHAADVPSTAILGPAAMCSSSRSAVMRLRTTERLATLPRADDELGVFAV